MKQFKIANISTAKIDNVPKWVRLATGFFALLNLAFGIMSYIDMHILFKDGTGLDLDNAVLKRANYEFASKSLAIGLTSVFVTIIKCAPEAVIILTIVRALAEIQTIIISIVQGHVSAMISMSLTFLVVEILIIKTLMGVIKKEK